MRPVRILVTNDDGVDAPGILALRQALDHVGEVFVIAPDANRSAIARGITIHDPLVVDDVLMADGHPAQAVSGTPVDCVRLGALGLIGDPPDVVVSGANLGLNLGDDVTYSGTVAAAFEGVVLGIPAIAVSQQSREMEMDYGPRRDYDFDLAARFTASLVRELGEHPLPEGTLLNINVPGGEPEGVEVTRLGKRLYRDELELVDGSDPGSGRRTYRIYGYEPGLDDEPGTDVGAIARSRLTVTPLHLDLTHHGSLEGLRQRDFERVLEGSLG